MDWLANNIGWPAGLALLGGVITLAGVVIGGYQQNSKDNELRDKTAEIARLNKRIADLVTGESALSVDFALEQRKFADGTTRSEALISLVNETENNAYDVVLNAVDVLRADRLKTQYAEGFAARLALQGMFQKSLGTVTGKQAVALTNNPLVLPTEINEAIYEFRITTRGGIVNQVVRFIRRGAKWTFATKAVHQDGSVVYKHIEADYPEQHIDRDDWWKP